LNEAGRQLAKKELERKKAIEVSEHRFLRIREMDESNLRVVLMTDSNYLEIYPLQ
jgi:hypothetical protein